MFINVILKKTQNTKFAKILQNSFFFENIDKFAFAFLAAAIISTAFAPTSIIGVLASIFSMLILLKVLFKKNETAELSIYNKILIIYLLFVIISLMGSSYFILSLKGIIKTFIYIAFYFASVYFLSENRKKIIPLLYLIAAIIGFESIVAIIQNLGHIEAIATWQDTSNLTSTREILSRAYGTLKPYNPNLLAGYLIAGLSSIFAVFGVSYFKKDKKMMFISSITFFAAFFAVFATGCRGAYLGLFGFFAVLFIAFLILVKKYSGGIKGLKAKYKMILSGFIAAFFGVIILVPSFLKRILSIFSMRKDSSISFRMNVYEACYNMFLDNKFLGIGVGNKNFREIYGLYMKTGFDALGAYSVPLEIAVESGIFALIAFFAFIVSIVVKIISYLKFKGAHFVHKVIVFSVLLMFFAVFAHGLFDTVFFRPQIQLLFWLNVAIFHAITVKRSYLKKQRLAYKKPLIKDRTINRIKEYTKNIINNLKQKFGK